ncbi:MAG: CHAT domain-containing tetratricopeptide repeat protein [Acidimicrobiales bacterium]
MTADEHLERLAAAAGATPPDVGVLAALGLGDAEGLSAVVDLARRVMRDDPGAGARLARLARDGAIAAGLEAEVGPAADYALAQASAAAGELQTALVLLDRARAGFEAAGAWWSALRTNLGRTHILNEMGRHGDALAASRAVVDALGRSRELAPDRSEKERTELLAAAEQNSALCHELMGAFEQALAAYDRAEDGYRRAGEARAEAEVRYDRALLLLDLGRHGEALDALDAVTEVFRQGGFRALLAGALTHTAEAHLQRGELDRCLVALNEARDALASIEAPTGDHERSLVAGRAYLELRLLPEALATFDEAARFLDGSDLVIEQARVQWGRGLALAGLARRSEAMAAMDAAVARFRQSGHHGWLAGALVDRARLAQAQGSPDGARTDATEALDLARAHRLLVAEVRAGLVLADLGNGPADALPGLRAARAVAGQLPLRPLVAEVEHALGRCLAARGETAEAEQHLLASIEALESTRGTLSDDALLSRYLDDRRSPYEDLLHLLLTAPSADPAVAAADVAERALDLAERAKSRALGELMAGLTVPPSAGPADDDELVELRAVQRELFAQGLTAERRNRLHQRLVDLEHQDNLRRVQRSERAVRHHAADGTAPNPAARPSGARPVASGATSGTAVLAYSCANGAIHAFVAGSDPTVAVTAIASQAEVAELVNRLRLQMGRVAAAGDRLGRQLAQLVAATDGVLEQLHRLLIDPVSHALPAGDRTTPLVIVPDGPLRAVPFHALHRGGERLSGRYVISYAPSLAVRRAAPPPAAGPALVIGVADELAPQVEDEARLVADTLGGATLLLGADATWDRVTAELVGAAHLHLCGHAVYRPDNPMYSALRLGDRWVSAADLLRLDLTGRTVVLSACTTAGDGGHPAAWSAAEGHGFVRAVLGAGASSVMASLWLADDATTTRIMDSWYRTRHSRGPAGALRDALEAAAADTPHPYHWAPWVLIGRPEG